MAAAPQLAVDVGFALSVLATAALIVIAPVWSRRLVARGCPKPLADALAVAWAAHVVTVPLVAGISGRVSAVGAVANLAVAAVIAPITVLGSAAAVVCLAVAGGRTTVDPIHRARTVVGAEGRALGGRYAWCDAARSGGSCRACWWWVLPRCWWWCCGGGGGFASRRDWPRWFGCRLVAVGTSRPGHDTIVG